MFPSCFIPLVLPLYSYWLTVHVWPSVLLLCLSCLRYTRNSWTPGWFLLLWKLGQTEIVFVFTLTHCRCFMISPNIDSTTSNSMLMLCTFSRMYHCAMLQTITVLYTFLSAAFAYLFFSSCLLLLLGIHLPALGSLICFFNTLVYF